MPMSTEKNMRNVNETTIPEAYLGPCQHLRSNVITKIVPS